MSHQEARATRHKQSDSQSHPEHAGRIQRAPVSPLAMRSVQTKLEVNEPGDVFEQQADTVADTVMRSPMPSSAPSPTPSGAPAIQRMAQDEEPCTDCDQNPRQIQREPMPDEETVQREEMPDDETVQRDGDGLPSVTSHTASVINSPGPGSPLPTDVRQRVEPHLGTDLSNVRVHNDTQSAQAAGSLQARAFTYGSDIFLNSTESASDMRLMAHESTHVAQQNGGIHRQPMDEELESSASSDMSAAPVSEAIAEPAQPVAASVASPVVSPSPVAEAAAAPEPVSMPAAVPPVATPVALPVASPVAAVTAAAVAPAAGPASVSSGSAPETRASTEVTPEAPDALVEAPEGAAGPLGDGAVSPGADTGAPAPVAAGGADVGVEMLMPEPPAGLSPAAERRLGGVQSRAGGAARAQSTMPAAESTVAEARGAVTEPAAETQARAEGALVAALDERPEPSAEIEALCERIREVIRKKRPSDEDSLVEAKPDQIAQQAGGELNRNVAGDAGRVQGQYNQMQGQPQGTPASQPAPIAGTPPAQQTTNIDATQAAPDAVPAEAVSLDADVAANQQRMEAAGMNSKTAQAVQEGPIAEAREAQGELVETAERDPQEVLAEQEAAIASAQTDMGDLQARALTALQEARGTTTAGTANQQTQMVGSEEQMRQQVGRRSNEIFDSAQTRVDGLLRDLPRTAMQRWDSGIARHSETFKQALRSVQDWIDNRHKSTLLAVWDYVAGLPKWVTEEYNRAECEFGDNVCALMREISREVNGVVAACQAIIQQARKDIEALYASLPADMQAWAQEEQARIGERLDGLSNSVNETRDNFNRDMRQRASQAVQDVRTQIQGLRQAAGGLIGRVVDAVKAFLEDPLRAIINGLLSLVNIPPASFWALVDRIQQVIGDIADDPMNFANNLMEALKLGFQQFFDNIGTHLLNGLLQWLFSAMGNVGVTMPKDFSLKSIITFFLQIMGISWARIRKLLAKYIGEQNVAIIEQAWQLVSTLIEQGPQGIFDMIKDQLNPQNILDMILQTAIDFVKEALIKQVAVRIIAMLNPAGAVAQAIQLIYKLLKWLFENAARIFTLIETIVNGVANLVAGNIGGMASAVEGALARIIPIVIDFLAGLMELGDLPEQIAGAVKRLQDMVERILDRVIKFLVDKAKALLKRLLSGKKPDEPDNRTPEQKQQDLNRGLQAGEQLLEDETKSPDEVKAGLPAIKRQFRMKSLQLVEDAESETTGTYHVVGEINPSGKGKQKTKIVRMKLVKVTFLYHAKGPEKQDKGEFERQLAGQQAGINRMYVNNWLNNRAQYMRRKTMSGDSGRHPDSDRFQQEFRDREWTRVYTLLINNGNSEAKARRAADAHLKDKAALHDPDQVAGGAAARITGLGNLGINSSIGAQWSSLVDPIVEEARNVPAKSRADVKMWVKLDLEPRK